MLVVIMALAELEGTITAHVIDMGKFELLVSKGLTDMRQHDERRGLELRIIVV
jgi:hypothetical protein